MMTLISAFARRLTGPLFAVIVAALFVRCGSDSLGTRPGTALFATPRTLFITGGDTARYWVVELYANGSSAPVSVRSWISTDTLTAVVDASGLVTSRAVGTSTIRAQTRDSTFRAVVTVVGHPHVDHAVDSVILGGHFVSALYALGPLNQRYVLSARWWSADASIATVEVGGRVAGVAVGHATVWGGYGNDSASVVAQVAPLLHVTPGADTLFLGDSIALGVLATDTAGNPVPTPAPITWSSSNLLVATVDASGRAKGIAPGPAVALAHFDWATGHGSLGVTPRYVSIAIANGSGCGIDSASVGWCWNYDPVPMGDGVTDSARTLAAAHVLAGAPKLLEVGGGDHGGCGLGIDARAYCWHDLFPSYGMSDAVAEGPIGLPARLAVGYSHRCGWIDGGHPICWVDDQHLNVGQADDPAPHTFSTLNAGFYHTCGIEGGVVLCWGAAARMRLGSVVTTTNCGGWIIELCSSTPLVVPDLPAMASVSGGGESTCGIATDGTGWCWGSNEYGQLGSDDPGGDGADYAPRPIAGGLHFQEIAVGFWHACGVTTADDVYCWGELAEVGGTPITPFTPCADRYTGSPQRCYFTPTLVHGLKARALRSAHLSTCGLRADGAPLCWEVGRWM